MKRITIILSVLYCSCRTTAVSKIINNEIRSYKLQDSDTLVDIGCGDASYDREIAHYYPDLFLIPEDLPFDANGHDITKSVTMSMKNSRYTPKIENHFRFVAGYEDSVPLPSSAYKRILCRKTLHEFIYPSKMIKELNRILCPEGIITIIEADPQYIGQKDPYCKKEYLTKEKIISLFQSFHLMSDTAIKYRDGVLNILNFKK